MNFYSFDGEGKIVNDVAAVGLAFAIVGCCSCVKCCCIYGATALTAVLAVMGIVRVTLKKDGVEIVSVRGGGYRIDACGIMTAS